MITGAVCNSSTFSFLVFRILIIFVPLIAERLHPLGTQYGLLEIWTVAGPPGWVD